MDSNFPRMGSSRALMQQVQPTTSPAGTMKKAERLKAQALPLPPAIKVSEARPSGRATHPRRLEEKAQKKVATRGGIKRLVDPEPPDRLGRNHRRCYRRTSL